ncbi:MAG: ribulokinase [Lachnospiraceae bacterium]
MKKYSMGIDYGTLSGRVLIVDIENGQEIASSEYAYPHAVMDDQLPSGKKLDIDYALEHPADFIDVLKIAVPDAVKKSGIDASQIIGIGVDFTSCSVMPVKADNTPLCFLEKYKDEPHAYVKLWKHHAAQDEANKITAMAQKMGEKWLDIYGKKTSSEWLFAKLWQILDEAPEIYDDMDCFLEAGDWLTWFLTGNLKRSACQAGYKAFWNKGLGGYPSKEFFKALDPRLENVVEEKLKGEVVPLGTCVGGLTKQAAELMGLKEDTPVAVSVIDAHVCVPAVKIASPGKMLAIMGTSTCHMLLAEEEKPVPGVCGYVEDGILPGFIGYEAGQACAGDHFAWFVENCVPESYRVEAKKQGVSIHVYLQQLASKLSAGQSGLLALDWWNGNRSILVDADLTGLMLGMTLTTKPEEMYRALVEATAFGTRMIIENFEKYGVRVDEFYASGGIAEKSPFAMQIYSDVIKKPIRISGSTQSCALGSAIFGAVVGKAHPDIVTAAEKMGKLKDVVFYPDEKSSQVYDKLFAEYATLQEYFFKQNDVMKKLKHIKQSARNI